MLNKQDSWVVRPLGMEEGGTALNSLCSSGHQQNSPRHHVFLQDARLQRPTTDVVSFLKRGTGLGLINPPRFRCTTCCINMQARLTLETADFHSSHQHPVPFVFEKDLHAMYTARTATTKPTTKKKAETTRKRTLTTHAQTISPQGLHRRRPQRRLPPPPRRRCSPPSAISAECCPPIPTRTPSRHSCSSCCYISNRDGGQEVGVGKSDYP